jgi:hypothetical protein
MYNKDKKAAIIILISSSGLIILGLNQIVEFFEFPNQKIAYLSTIIFSILNFIFISKLIKPK